MTAAAPRGRVLTFYSYKGGTGRSMALANIAWILACNGRKVLVIDWDLEAPGLHRYFHPFLIDKELSASYGLVDMVDNYANQAIRPVAENETVDADWFHEYTDFSDYLISVNFDTFAHGGKLDLLPAGRQDERYAVTVSSFGWQNFYDRLGGGGFFEAVKERARASYDYVLIDSRTGVSDTAGICSVQMPDSLVVCFTYNNQSIKGSAAVARSAAKMRARMLDEQRGQRSSIGSLNAIVDASNPYRVFPVPMRVDDGESDRLAVRQAFARESFEDLVTHIGSAALAEYWTRVEVPHRPFYSYEEVLAPFKDDPHDPKTVLGAFLRLTSYLTDSDVTDYRLPIRPDEKLRWLRAFGEVPQADKSVPPPEAASKETPDEALARTAEAAFSTLPSDDRQVAHGVLSRVVRLGREEEGGRLSPIRAPFSDFSDREQAMVGTLASLGLVRVVSESRTVANAPVQTQAPRASAAAPAADDRSVELADERLLTVWRTLIDRIQVDRDFLVWRQRLRAYLGDWERNGRDDGALLSGRLLSEADGWTVRRAGDLNATETAYIDASRRRPSTVIQTDAPLVVGPEKAVVLSGASRGLMIVAVVSLFVIALTGALVLWRGGPRPAVETKPTPVEQRPTPGPSPAPESSKTPAATTTPALPTTGGRPEPSKGPPPSASMSAPDDDGADQPPVDEEALKALLYQGERALQRGDRLRAQQAYEKVIALDPSNRPAYEGLLRARALGKK